MGPVRRLLGLLHVLHAFVPGSTDYALGAGEVASFLSAAVPTFLTARHAAAQHA